MNPRLEESFDFSVCLGSDTDTPKALAAIPSRRGLVVFADANDTPIQLLMCADLRRSARARLLTQSETPTRRADIAAVCTQIYYSPIDAEFACQLAYNQQCRRLFADTCDGLISLPKPCFVRIEQRRKLSYFIVSERCEIQDDCWGPFISRKAAGVFAEILNAAFDLCRNPECLASGRFTSCPYYQMKTCAGPCLDASQAVGYQQNLDEAVQTASGEAGEAIAQKQAQMRQAAERLEFEKARHLRMQIEQIESLKKSEFQYIHPLARFRMLHIDRVKSSKKKPKWVAFILTGADYTELAFDAETVDAVLEALANPQPVGVRPQQDYLPTLSLFLYRSRRPGIWVDCGDAIPSRQQLLEHLQSAEPEP